MFDEYDDFLDDENEGLWPGPFTILVLLLLILALLIPFVMPIVWAWYEGPSPTPTPSFWEKEKLAYIFVLESYVWYLNLT